MYIYNSRMVHRKKIMESFADYKCRIPIDKSKFSFAYCGILKITPTELRVVNLVVFWGRWKKNFRILYKISMIRSLLNNQIWQTEEGNKNNSIVYEIILKNK